MVAVLSYLAVCLLVASPFGVALWRHLSGRMPAPPVPYVRCRPERDEHVAVAESAVYAAYRDLAPLYDTPTVTGPPAR